MQNSFTVDHLLELQELTTRTPFRLSPDGGRLAVTVRDIRRGGVLAAPAAEGGPCGGSCVVVIDTASGEAHTPFSPGSSSAAPRWSPDGMRLAAFVQHEGPACLAIWDRATGGTCFLRGAEMPNGFGYEIPQWLPEGRGIVVRVRPTGSPAGPVGAVAPTRPKPGSLQVFSYDPVAAKAAAGSPEGSVTSAARGVDLAVVDAASGEVQRLASGWSFTGFRVAPDGHAIAVLRTVSDPELPRSECYDLVTVSLADGNVCQLAPRVQSGYGCSFNWSPDSRQIAFIHAEAGRPSRLLVVPADGSAEPRVISGDLDLEIPDDEYYHAPLWSPDGRIVYCLWRAVWAFAADGGSCRKIAPDLGRMLRAWVQPPSSSVLSTPDGRSLLITTSDRQTQKDGLARLDLETGEGEMLAEFDHMWSVHVWGIEEPFAMETATDGSACYLAAEAAEHPPRILRLAGDFRTGEPLFSLKPDLAAVRLGKSHVIEYRTLRSKGKTRRALLMLPPGYQDGQRLPVVVNVYPYVGLSPWRNSFGFNGYNPGNVTNAHLFTSRGYAFLKPEVLVERQHRLRQFAGEVVPAINHLVEMGIADPSRICLIGHSRGGHAALALITQTELFCAAVVSAGELNLLSYGTIGDEGNAPYSYYETGDATCGGTPWEKRDAYIENSPFFHLDRVTTPLLVVCGTASRGEEMQARQTYGALRRLDRRVELRLYQDEEHSPSGWSEANLREVTERILNWFDSFTSAPP